MIDFQQGGYMYLRKAVLTGALLSPIAVFGVGDSGSRRQADKVRVSSQGPREPGVAQVGKSPHT
jgi:hypothetical protein